MRAHRTNNGLHTIRNSIQNTVLLFSVVSFLFFAGCKKEDNASPQCLGRSIVIAEIEHPIKVTEYRYAGKKVYLIEPRDPEDGPSTLLDDQCVLICSLTSGSGGVGDLQCPNFWTTAVKQEVIYPAP